MITTNNIYRLNSPSGPEVRVVEVSEGKVYVLSEMEVSEGSELYDTQGQLSGVVGNKLTSDKATFYESRSEQQALDEGGNAGWRVKHLGWQVGFERGIALYGELASVNQNRQNVGIEGPTSTNGTDGSPAVLIQKVNIVNAPVQVNGWKSYDSPTAYLLDPADVQQVDAAYVYADAFISWSADSSVVSTSGSDMNNLVEYPPTNTIRYTT